MRLKPLLFFALLLAGWSVAAPPSPVPPPGKADRCAVCGMFVKPFPSWLSALVFEDGKIEYFDGPKDMFKRYFSLGDKGRKAKVYVTDYYSTQMIDGPKAFFVTGSDVLGPMGHDLVPLSSPDTAKAFKKDHAGAKTLKFDEITEAAVIALE